MEWQFLVAMAVVIPILLVPVIYVWFINIGGLYRAARKTIKKAEARHAEEKLAHAHKR